MNDARRRVIQKRIKVFTVLALIVLGPLALLIGGPLALVAYDKSHLTSIDCTVVSAKTAVGSTRSSKGIGNSMNQVSIKTNCGEFLLEAGVTAANRSEIAQQLDRGGLYRFDIGEGSWKLRSLLEAVRIARVVYRYEPSGSSWELNDGMSSSSKWAHLFIGPKVLLAGPKALPNAKIYSEQDDEEQQEFSV
jgi:hypothetical protein